MQVTGRWQFAACLSQLKLVPIDQYGQRSHRKTGGETPHETGPLAIPQRGQGGSSFFLTSNRFGDYATAFVGGPARKGGAGVVQKKKGTKKKGTKKKGPKKKGKT